MKNHGLIRVDKTLLKQIRMEQEKREKEEQDKKDRLKTKPRPLWRNDWNK
jgi:hypothetical protein